MEIIFHLVLLICFSENCRALLISQVIKKMYYLLLELQFLEDDVPPICSQLLPLFICGVLSVFTEVN